MATARLRQTTRIRLSNMERSDMLADDIARAIDKRPATHSIRQALEVIADRTIQITDDRSKRSGGKVRTWATHRDIRASSGTLMRRELLSPDMRRKMVAATIGSMLVAYERATQTWVLDAVDEALGYLPWKFR